MAMNWRLWVFDEKLFRGDEKANGWVDFQRMYQIDNENMGYFQNWRDYRWFDLPNSIWSNLTTFFLKNFMKNINDKIVRLFVKIDTSIFCISSTLKRLIQPEKFHNEWIKFSTKTLNYFGSFKMEDRQIVDMTFFSSHRTNFSLLLSNSQLFENLFWNVIYKN